MVRNFGYCTKMKMEIKQRRSGKMNNKLRMVLKKRYESEIADALYKIECFSNHELVIPEHPDLTAEVDKQLALISSAEDKLAVMELHYGKNGAKQIL